MTEKAEQWTLGPRTLISAGTDAIRAYEDAATAIGRLDAAACLADGGFRDLLVLRCIATATGSLYTEMIALARSHGEGEESDSGVATFAAALREGAARARGGALPSLASLHELLRRSPVAGLDHAIDELLRDAHERTPPVLKAALAAQALRMRTDGESSAGAEHLVGLAVPLLLCVGGATTDAWITLPRTAPSLRETFAALAREARAAERGLAAARDLCAADDARVRDALGRAAYSALDVLALLRRDVVITIPETARALGLTPPTAGAAVTRLVELGIAREVTGKARLRAFAYDEMVRAFAP